MEQILQKLSEIEITAQRIMQDADRTKAALSAEMEQQCKDLDLELEQETNRMKQGQQNNQESRKDQEQTALRQQTEQHLADLDVYYKENHRQLSEDLFQQLLKR